MKKLIGTVVLAAMVATSAFAELNIGAGYNHGVWTPFLLTKEKGKDAKIEMQLGSPWGGGARVGVSFAGTGENIGFVLDIKGDGGSIAVNDNAYVWAKPWDWLEIRAGNYYGDALKNAQSYGIRGSNRIGLGNHETTTFARISSDGSYDGTMNGALLAITPIEGLFIGAGFDIGNGLKKEAVDVFKDSQYAVGYTIDSLLAIKAQYMGGATAGIFATADTKDADLLGTINAGVDLLMLEGMKIGVGAFIPLEKDSTISLAATLDGGFDELSINAYVGALIARSDAAYHGVEVGVGVGVGYDLGNGVGLSADLRYGVDLPKASGLDTRHEITVGLFASKGLSNGTITLGVEGDFNVNKANDAITLAIPLSIQCGF